MQSSYLYNYIIIIILNRYGQALLNLHFHSITCRINSHSAPRGSTLSAERLSSLSSRPRSDRRIAHNLMIQFVSIASTRNFNAGLDALPYNSILLRYFYSSYALISIIFNLPTKRLFDGSYAHKRKPHKTFTSPEYLHFIFFFFFFFSCSMPFPRFVGFFFGSVCRWCLILFHAGLKEETRKGFFFFLLRRVSWGEENGCSLLCAN